MKKSSGDVFAEKTNPINHSYASAVRGNKIKNEVILPPVPDVILPVPVKQPVPDVIPPVSKLKYSGFTYIPPYRSFIPMIPGQSIHSLMMLLSSHPDHLEGLVKTYFPYYTVSTEEFSHDLCTLLIIYGFLTVFLSQNKICKLIIKGGKALQKWYPIKSNDIDVMIIPYATPLDDERVLSIGQDIIDFIMKTLNYDKIWLSKSPSMPIDVKSIYKIAKRGRNGTTALSDIGVGYKYLSPYVQKLYTEECITMYEFNEITMYYTLCPESFIKEKIYYLLYYSFVHVPAPYEKAITQLFTTKALNQLAVSDIFKRKYADTFGDMVVEVCDELKIDPTLAMDNLLNYRQESNAGKTRKKLKTKKLMKKKKINLKKTKTTRK